RSYRVYLYSTGLIINTAGLIRSSAISIVGRYLGGSTAWRSTWLGPNFLIFVWIYTMVRWMKASRSMRRAKDAWSPRGHLVFVFMLLCCALGVLSACSEDEDPGADVGEDCVT